MTDEPKLKRTGISNFSRNFLAYSRETQTRKNCRIKETDVSHTPTKLRPKGTIKEMANRFSTQDDS